MKPKIGTVILNYNTYNDTLECVNSLKNQTYDNQEIIIVDNGSTNNSTEFFTNEYKDDPMVTLIFSNENLGFAKGNNLGIRYAKEKLNCDYVFVLNSDTIIPDGIFNEVVKIDCSNIGVINPSCQQDNEIFYGNQVYIKELDLKSIYYKSLYFYEYIKHTKQIFKYSNTLKDKIMFFIFRFLNEIMSFLYKNIVYKVKMKNINYSIIGCAYFLTPSFFLYYNQIYPETFLYYEELYLIYYLYKVNLKTLNIETPFVIHKEGQSREHTMKHNEKNQKDYNTFLKNSLELSKKLFKLSYDEIKEKYN